MPSGRGSIFIDLLPLIIGIPVVGVIWHYASKFEASKPQQTNESAACFNVKSQDVVELQPNCLKTKIDCMAQADKIKGKITPAAYSNIRLACNRMKV